MTRWLIAAAIVAVLAVAAAGTFAGLYFTKGSESEAAASRCDDKVFGHIRSLERKGAHYVLRFDPAWFTSGVTANTAAAEDGAVEPGEPVPNDNYVIDEGHRLLTYLVPADAQVTVLVNNPSGILSTPISVSELAEIVKTGKSSQRKLFEPLDSGVWMRYRIDTACSLDQQYRP